MINKMKLEQDNLSQAMPDIWEEIQEIYHISINPEIRQCVETKLRHNQNIREVTLNELRNMVDKDCRALALWSKYHSREVDSAKEGERQSAKRIYKKCFETRIKKLNFVVERTITSDELSKQTLKPSERIDWNLLCDKWNKMYPRHKLAPAGFKTEYFKARNEEGAVKECFRRMANNWYAVLAPIADHIETSREFLYEIEEALGKYLVNDVVKPLRNYHFKCYEFKEAVRHIDDTYNSKMQVLREMQEMEITKLGGF